ncbi:hypothetical protein AGMMS50289_14620 [Betaproteobacteria bacterium]|nr:hypothetical protein AGMMS50289_14620 [Betaproteobacteria bacterium]
MSAGKTPTFSPFATRGFTLLELALVLVALGVLTLFASSAFSGSNQKQVRQQSSAEAEVAREAIRYFVLANKRLPCPDIDNNGYEDCVGGQERGFLPYLNLGLTENVSNRMRYAVYRNSGDNDVTRLVERTGDAENTPDYMGYGDTLAALELIQPFPVNPAHIHVAGIDAAGVSTCDNGSHPAFLLIVPNQDQDADDNPFDGVNVSGNCFANPLQPFAWNYDDFVATESLTALMGWLTRHINP